MHYLAPVRRRETIGQYHDHHRPFEALLKKKKKKKKKRGRNITGLPCSTRELQPTRKMREEFEGEGTFNSRIRNIFIYTQ
jgi:hypothetical protein